jgi:transposase-like protein
MRKKRCIFCGGNNTRFHDRRSKKVKTSYGRRTRIYRRWFCKDCGKPFTPTRIKPINFSLKINVCQLYYDAECSYRAVSRQIGVSAYRLFQIIDRLGANCKSTIQVARELQPRWFGYLLIDEKSVWIKGIEWYLLVAVDLQTQDIVHWDLVFKEDETEVAWFLIVIKLVIAYPFQGLISDLLPAFYGTRRWLLPEIMHQFCTIHAYNTTERYIKYHYKGGNKLWASRLLLITRIICNCQRLETAQRALQYLERHQSEIRKAKLIRRLNLLRLRFPYLIPRFNDQNLRPNNNVVENVIRQLNMKFKKMAGFESYETAYHSIRLLIMRYRFHKFECSRVPGHNGKCPLELAGVDTSTINWVRFSQRNS